MRRCTTLVFSLKRTERCCFFPSGELRPAPSTFGSGFFTNPKSRVGNQQLRKSSERCLFVHYMSPFYLCNKKIWQIKTNQTSNTSPHNIQVFLRHEKRNQPYLLACCNWDVFSQVHLWAALIWVRPMCFT